MIEHTSKLLKPKALLVDDKLEAPKTAGGRGQVRSASLMNSPCGISRSSKQQYLRTASQWSFPMGQSTASSSIGPLSQSLTKKAWSFSRLSAHETPKSRSSSWRNHKTVRRSPNSVLMRNAMILLLLRVPLYAIVCKRITVHTT